MTKTLRLSGCSRLKHFKVNRTVWIFAIRSFHLGYAFMTSNSCQALKNRYHPEFGNAIKFGKKFLLLSVFVLSNKLRIKVGKRDLEQSNYKPKCNFGSFFYLFDKDFLKRGKDLENLIKPYLVFSRMVFSITTLMLTRFSLIIRPMNL